MRHKTWLYFVLSGIFALGLAGCTPTNSFPYIPLPGAGGTPLSTAPPANITPRPKPQATFALSATAAPTGLLSITVATTTNTAAPVATRAGQSTARSSEAAATAQEPSPTSSPSAGWTTFVSRSLQVAVDYPADWRPVEQATSVTFTSPQGVAIQLAMMETGSLPPEDYVRENQLPNTRCTMENNDYGLTARICLDTLSRSYSADIPVEWPNGAKALLTLAMFQGGDLQVFQTMVRSVRPAS